MKRIEKLCGLAAGVLLAAVVACGGICQEVFADADSPSLNLDVKGSITVDLNSEGLENVSVEGTLAIYKVADIVRDSDGNLLYTYTEDFSGCPCVLDDVGKALLASEIYTWLSIDDVDEESRQDEKIVNSPEPVAAQAVVGGKTVFTDLDTGLYLVVQTEGTEGYYTIKPFLASIPLAQTDESGNSEWVYDVDTKPKMEFEEPQTETEAESEPESEPLTESETEPESEPQTEPETEPETTETTLPQTGQLYWPIPLLVVGGILLAGIGWILVLSQKRKNHDA